MARILLVQNDPGFCRVVSDYLKASSTAELAYALTGKRAAKMLAGGRFEVALISATLPDASGIDLAALAANQNIPVLLLSEDAGVSEELERLHVQYLQQPFTLDALLSELQRVMLDRRENIDRICASISKRGADLDALRAEIAEAHRLFDAILARLGYWRR